MKPNEIVERDFELLETLAYLCRVPLDELEQLLNAHWHSYDVTLARFYLDAFRTSCVQAAHGARRGRGIRARVRADVADLLRLKLARDNEHAFHLLAKQYGRPYSTIRSAFYRK